MDGVCWSTKCGSSYCDCCGDRARLWEQRAGKEGVGVWRWPLPVMTAWIRALRAPDSYCNEPLTRCESTARFMLHWFTLSSFIPLATTERWVVLSQSASPGLNDVSLSLLVPCLSCGVAQCASRSEWGICKSAFWVSSQSSAVASFFPFFFFLVAANKQIQESSGRSLHHTVPMFSVKRTLHFLERKRE